MKLQQNKPSRTLGILFVIVIMVVLTSGLAPPAGAQDSMLALTFGGRPY